MRRAATILGIAGGLVALLAGFFALTFSSDESAAVSAMFTMLWLPLLTLGVIAIVGAVLGRVHRSLSLGLLIAAGLLMLVMSLCLFIAVWRDPTVMLSPSNVVWFVPGILTSLAAMFRSVARPKLKIDGSLT